MNNKRTKGVSGFTLLLFAVVLFAVLWYTSRFEERDRQLSWEEFQTLVTSDEVAGVTVRQNRSVPTGRVEVELKSEDEEGDIVKYLYVSDVNEIQDYLKEQGVNYAMPDVPEDNWLMTTLLPVLLMMGGVFLIFALMNRQGAGANTKAGPSGGKRRTGGNRRFPEVTKEIYPGRGKNPQRRTSGRTSGNRKDAACQGGGRRSRSTLLYHFRV